MNDTFLSNVDTNKVDELMSSTDTNVKYFNDVSKTTSDKYTYPLDELMGKIYASISNTEDGDITDVPTETLEKYYLELTSLLYFMGTKQEQLSIYNDMSKASAKEVYNKSYLNNQVTGNDGKSKQTIASLQAQAEQDSQYDSVVNSIYDHSYKVVKFKIDAGYEMVTTLKNVIKRRMQEQSLVLYTPKTVEE